MWLVPARTPHADYRSILIFDLVKARRVLQPRHTANAVGEGKRQVNQGIVWSCKEQGKNQAEASEREVLHP